MSDRGGDRGRGAESPTQVPASGWRDVAIRVKRDLGRDHVSIIAAGVAFYAFLAVFPALAAVIALYGLVADPADVKTQMEALGQAIPAGASQVLGEQMSRLAATPHGTLSVGLIIGLLVALWSASKGMKAMMEALNIAYDEEESRGFFRRTLTTLLLTFGAVGLVIVAIGLVVGVPAVLGKLGLGESGRAAVQWLRWPLLGLALLAALAVLYRFGPSRADARWRWITPGSLAAAAVWIAGSAGFSFYVSRFGSYEKTYGSMAAIAVLLLWLLVAAYAVILGAELNAELERQTAKDTTTGQPKPMGARKAFAADTVGETP